MVPDDVAAFGGLLTEVLVAHLGEDLVGVYFVGSIALGGYVAGESDVDVVAVCDHRLPAGVREVLAEALADATGRCPSRGLELTLYARNVASSTSNEAGFEINVNGGPRMDRLVRLSPDGQPGFWYVLDRAVAHRCGVAISGAPADTTFADLRRRQLLEAMRDSMRWHRIHERATLYSVLNAARAWRYAADDVLGSKLEGAAWARSRWHRPRTIDAAVDLRHGRRAELDGDAVQELLDHVEAALLLALRDVENA